MARTPTTRPAVVKQAPPSSTSKKAPAITTTENNPRRKRTPKAELADPSWLSRHVSENIRVLKAKRRVSDAVIAERGGYTSRQVFYSRLTGRTDYSAEDFTRIAAALDVTPAALLLPEDELLRWVAENPAYKGPTYRTQTAKGE